MSVLQIRRQSKTWLARRASEGLLLPRLRVGLTTGSGLTNRTSRQNVFGFGTRATPEEKAALEIYITGRFGERIKEPTFWENKYVAKRIFQRGLAEAIVARTPTPSPEELARAVKIAYPEGDPLEAYEAYEEELATLLSPEELHGIPLWLLFPLMFGVCFAMVSVMLLSLTSIAVTWPEPGLSSAERTPAPRRDDAGYPRAGGPAVLHQSGKHGGDIYYDAFFRAFALPSPA